jgi:hypothetical protein
MMTGQEISKSWGNLFPTTILNNSEVVTRISIETAHTLPCSATPTSHNATNYIKNKIYDVLVVQSVKRLVIGWMVGVLFPEEARTSSLLSI